MHWLIILVAVCSGIEHTFVRPAREREARRQAEAAAALAELRAYHEQRLAIAAYHDSEPDGFSEDYTGYRPY